MPIRVVRMLNIEGIPHAIELALMMGLMVLALAIPVTVFPLQAFELLGSTQQVSMLFTAVGVMGLGGALTLPYLLTRLGRYRLILAGLTCILLAAVLFPLDSRFTFFVAVVLYTWGFFSVDIIVNTITVERVERRRFARFEAVRMAVLGLAFALGPWLGVQLSRLAGLWAPFAVMALVALSTGIWILWRRYVTPSTRTVRGHANPLRLIPRFARQPRLRLAYVLALARSSWWSVFFIYTPIYCVNNGFTAADAGLIVSVGSLFVMLAPLWGRLGAPLGMRQHLIIGYLTTAVACVAATLLAFLPDVVIGLLLVACLCASWIDAVGNAPFVRAVHPHERAEMISIYTTYRECGRIVPQSLFAVVLLVLPLSTVFAWAGLGLAAGAYYSRYIPKRY